MRTELLRKEKSPYHTKPLLKGIYGEASKIIEECDEFVDAYFDQENDLMALCELSDIIGAIDGFLKKYHPTITLETLILMSKSIQNAKIATEEAKHEQSF